MKRAWRKLLPPFFAVLLVIPVGLLVRPQKTDAVLGCLAGALFNSLIGGIQSIADTATKIPVSESTVAGNTGQTSGNTKGSLLKECILDVTAKQIARTVLQSFTKSVVNWINNGFEGKPAFITNPEGFLLDVADREFGREIQKIAPLLCSPFRLNLQFALGFQYSVNSREEVGCRLSDVIANVRGSYDTFVGGDFRSGGWQNWISIAGTRQNNVYGAYLSTVNRIDASIISATGEEIQLLNWGKGFQSWRSCEEYAPDEKNAAGKVIRKGECIKQGPIKTPGSIIVDQTSGTLQSSLRELEVADELDEIFGALVNQLLIRTMGPGGLLGTSQPDRGGGPSYLDQLVTTPEAAERLATIRPPEGINCSYEYAASGNPNNPNQVVLVSYEDANGVKNRLTADAYTADGNPVLKPPEQTWATYFEQARVGCRNKVNQFAEDANDDALGQANIPNVQAGATAPPPAASQTLEGNIALNKKADQRSIWGDWGYYPGPQLAVDGNRTGDENFGLSLSAGEYGESWWVVDLETEDRVFAQTGGARDWDIDEISEIKIYGPTAGSYGYYGLYSGFQLYVTTADPKLISTGELENSATVVHKGTYRLSNSNGKNDILYERAGGSTGSWVLRNSITFNPPIRGRYVMLRRTVAFENFGIAEVEVIGKQTQKGSGGGSSAVSPLRVTFEPANTSFGVQSPGESIAINPNSPIRLQTNKPLQNVRLRVQLRAGNSFGPAGGSDSFIMLNSSSPVAWKQYFRSFFLSFSSENKNAGTPSFVLQNDFGQYIINPIICDGTSAGLRGTCYNLGGLEAPATQATGEAESWIVFAEGLNLTPERPVAIGFVGDMQSSGFSARAVRILIEAKYTDESGIDQSVLMPVDFTVN